MIPKLPILYYSQSPTIMGWSSPYFHPQIPPKFTNSKRQAPQFWASCPKDATNKPLSPRQAGSKRSCVLQLEDRTNSCQRNIISSIFQYGHFKGCFILCVFNICHYSILHNSGASVPCNHPFYSLGYTARQLNMSLLL